MDSSSGRVIWTVNLGRFNKEGSDLSVIDMWLVREVGEGVNPTLAVIASRKAEIVRTSSREA